MSKKYDEIMNKIEVDGDMRRRILQNIQEAELSGTSKTSRFSRRKRYLAAAACFAVILAGALAAPAVWKQQTDTPDPGQESNLSDSVSEEDSIETCASADDLAQKVGFPVSDLSGLPFEIQETTYTAWWAELAEIDYSGASGESAVYRKSAGSEDNSGIYIEYADVREVAVNETSVTLKGADGSYELALWTDGKYAYSVWISGGISQEEWEELLTGHFQQAPGD